MMEDNRPKINAKKIIKTVLIILYQILVIMALILTMVIVLQRISANNQSIGGYKIFRVITGSMEPEYEVGEVIISKEVNPKDIKVGDDIVYLGRVGEYSGKIIMHNVVAIDTDENGDLIFHAKGLQSNSVEDPQIREDQIYGVVTYRSSILTILYDLATNIYSIFAIVIILVLNVFIAFNTPKKTKKKRKKRKIANTSDTLDEDFSEENLEEMEEDISEEADEDIEEDNDIIEDEEDKEDKAIQKDKDENIETLINEKMRQYYNKTIDSTKNKAQEKNTKSRKHK